MNYEGQICRPPMERASFMLPVEVGCSYNRCRFCTLFKHLKFRELPMSDVEAELQRVKNLGGHPKRIFLGDGNPFGLSTEHLLDILKLIVHPTGPWIPGLTLDSFLAGLIYGFFLYKRPIRLWRILTAKLIVALVINVVLGTFWLSQVYGNGFWVMAPARLVKNVIMWPINSLVLYLTLKVLETAGVFRMIRGFGPHRKKA